MILQDKQEFKTQVPSKSSIDTVRDSTFGGNPEATDSIISRHIIAVETEKELVEIVEAEHSRYKSYLTIPLLLLAIRSGKKDLIATTDWSKIDYDASRVLEREAMVRSAVETASLTKFIADSGFNLNINDKKFDSSLSKLMQTRIKSYNHQETKRISTIMSEAKRRQWTDERIALEIKRGAGLNSIQQKSILNMQRKMAEDGIPVYKIAENIDSYIESAKKYRAELTAKWESQSIVNEATLLVGALYLASTFGSEKVGKEWSAILDMKTGSSDRAMNGQIVGLNELFVDPLLTYSPLMRPPLRGNCRCTIELVLME